MQCYLLLEICGGENGKYLQNGGYYLNDNIYRRNINGNEMSCLFPGETSYFKTAMKEHCNINRILNSLHSLCAIDLTWLGHYKLETKWIQPWWFWSFPRLLIGNPQYFCGLWSEHGPDTRWKASCVYLEVDSSKSEGKLREWMFQSGRSKTDWRDVKRSSVEELVAQHSNYFFLVNSFISCRLVLILAHQVKS